MNPPTPKRVTHSLIKVIVFIGLAHAAVASAQSVPAAATTTTAPDKDKTEDVVALSPFTVNAEEDKGYRASSTLAGSRLKTSLKDLVGDFV